MTGREYNMLFELNARMGSSFAGSFSKAQQQISGMQKEIQQLSKTQGDISSYQKQQAAVEATKSKLSVLQQQYDNIQRELQETGGSSSELQNKLLAKQQQIDKTAASINRQTESLERMERELKSAGVNMENLGGETQRLGQKIDDLKREQEKAAEGARDFGEAGKDSAITVGDALAAAGITVALKKIYDAYSECVSVNGNFEESLSNVEALSGANAEEMKQLGDLAKELGATTKFTAKQSADAMGYMAMAGWDAQQMIAGMPGVLSLAAASGEDLANVSDIVTDSMTAFGLAADQTGHYADILAATAANSNTSVGIMGETFKKAAPIAGALRYSVEDVSVAIGLMANAGIKGSIAGTTLQNIFNGLLEGATLSGKAIGEVTLSTVNADGTMMDFSETIDMLRGYFAQLTDEERVNNAMALAGKRGYSGLLAILNATEADYAKLTTSINNCTGAAEKMAAVKMDNMNGQLTLLNSAWEAVQTTVGEQLTPGLTELYKIATSILGWVNDLLKAHPGLVKLLTVLVAGVGTYVVALTAYTVATRIAKAATDLLTASMLTNPFILAAAAIAAVVSAVVLLASSSDDAVPSVAELTAATKEMQEVMSESGSTYEDTKNQINGASALAEQYVTRLRELEAQGLDTAEAQAEYKTTVDKLNSVMPELNVTIDETTGLIKGGTDALLAQAEAWKRSALEAAVAEKYKTEMEAYGKALLEAATTTEELKQKETERGVLQDSLTAKEARRKTLLAEINALEKGSDDYLDKYTTLDSQLRSLGSEIDDLNFQIGENERYQGQLKNALEIQNEALSENEAEIERARVAAENYSSEMREIPDDAVEVVGAIDSMMSEMAALAAKYDEAYEAAYKSISGQFDLWDHADAVVATSVSSINSNLDSQIDYWNAYNDNLTALGERTSDIEGLSDVIASFADGSKESVAAIAGMATASDEDLRKMVENYQAVQAAQQDAADGIALISSGISEQVDELGEEFAGQIAGMDFSEEAASVAINTVNSYIAATEGMGTSVYNAYAALARTANSALYDGFNRNPNPNSNPSGYASGTSNATEGVHLVGERGPELVYFRGGETVLNAEKTAATFRGAEETAAVVTTYAPVTVSIPITVEGNADSDALERLEGIGEDLEERVMRILNDREENVHRGAFR